MKNLDKVINTLRKEYKKDISMLGSFKRRKESSFYILIGTVLSARAKDEATQPLTEQIFKKYNKPSQFASMPIAKLEKLVYKSGFYKQKAKRIKDISKILLKEYEGKVPSTMEELTALPGVGKKTAGCVMVYAFGKDEIPTDVHVAVISYRLGWTKFTEPDKITDDLKEKIPKKYWRFVNEVLVMHGKRVCETRKPHCSRCVISRYCPRIDVERSD